MWFPSPSFMAQVSWSLGGGAQSHRRRGQAGWLKEGAGSFSLYSLHGLCLLVPDLILSIRPSLQSRFLLREHPLEILVQPTRNSYGSFVSVGSPISPVLSWASGRVSLPPPPAYLQGGKGKEGERGYLFIFRPQRSHLG